jgi:hypothetical protein
MSDGLRHRLLVVAPTVLEAVWFAGGWLFDRALAGWEATVLVPDHADPRPLRILGARCGDLRTALECGHPVRPRSVAVGADVYGGDARVRALVHDAGADVLLWGDGWLTAGAGSGAVEHRLSVAARAFKAQALAAAAVGSEPVAGTELFRCGRSFRLVGSLGARAGAPV